MRGFSKKNKRFRRGLETVSGLAPSVLIPSEVHPHHDCLLRLSTLLPVRLLTLLNKKNETFHLIGLKDKGTICGCSAALEFVVWIGDLVKWKGLKPGEPERRRKPRHGKLFERHPETQRKGCGLKKDKTNL